MTTQKIEFYKGPAGGWGALRSVAQQLAQHRVAAKGAKTLLSANQPGGFDCPGCAWPDSKEAATFDFCENGVKAVAAEITADRATPEAIGRHTVAELATWSDHDLEALGRLTDPLVYDAATDRYVPVAWDDAFALVARHLRSLASPDEAIFYTSGRTSNEAAFLYQLFVREFGTNNFPDCSNMCHEPSGMGMKASIGVGKGTVTLDDFEHADAILVFGQNPGTNHPRMLGELRAASRRGARILSFNPLKERGLERFADPQDAVEMATLGSTRISSGYYQLKVGGDHAALTGLCKRLVELDDEAAAQGAPRVVDAGFIAEHTRGWPEFEAALRASPWDAIEAESGLSREQIHAAAATYAAADAAIACWGMGITQHVHAVATVQMIVNLLLMRGNIGRPGAGACPVRGHSNVQGDRTMGIYEKPDPAFLDRLGAVFGFDPPRNHGYETIGAIEAMRDGRASVFFAMGGNFAAATPDTEATAAALRRCALTAHVSTKLNRSHLVHGSEALILPCLGRTEIDVQESGPQAVTVEDSMSMVHLSRGVNAPVSDRLLSEPMIVVRLAEATLEQLSPGRSQDSCSPPRRADAVSGVRGPSYQQSKTPWRWLVADYARIRDKIEAVFPDFRDFNARAAEPGGFRLHNPASERVWRTASGKAQFAWRPVEAAAPLRAAQARRAERVLLLATMRSHDQYNTTIYGPNDRYRGVHGHRRVVFIHAADRAELGFEPGAWVDIESVYAGERVRRAERFLLVDYDIPRGCVASYYPETNPLVALASHAEGARTPASKAVPVVLRRRDEAAVGAELRR